MRINTKRVSVSMPEGLYEVLKKLADEKGCKVHEYVRWLLWTYVEEKEGVMSRLS